MSGCAAQQNQQNLFTAGGSRQQAGALASYSDEDCTHCKLCNVSFITRPQYAFHVRGLSHIQKLMAAQAGVLPTWTEAKRREAKHWQASGTIPAKASNMNKNTFTYPSNMAEMMSHSSFYQQNPMNSLSTGDGLLGAYPPTFQAGVNLMGFNTMASNNVASQIALRNSSSTIASSVSNNTFFQTSSTGTIFQQNLGTTQSFACSTTGSGGTSSATQGLDSYGTMNTSSSPAVSSTSGSNMQPAQNVATTSSTSVSGSTSNSSSRRAMTRSNQFYCDVCALFLSSSTMQSHLDGKKHERAIKQRETGKPLPRKVQERLSESGDVSGLGISTDLVDRFTTITDNEPVVGLSYVNEEPGAVGVDYRCDLCQFQVSDLSAIVSHVLGLDHRLAYLKKREPELHAKVDLTQSEFIQHHTARVLCIEAEEKSGRGVPMLRDPIKNTLQLKLMTDNKLGVQNIGGEELRAQSLEDFMIIGARRILHLQQLMTQNSLKMNEATAVQAITTDTASKPDKKVEVPQEKPSSEVERGQAIEDLKKTLLEDFRRRKMDSQLADKIVESRLQLLYEYERRRVPFDVARTRVIQEEERWNLLMEFERQNLSFEEAEQRIDHRHQLVKMYEKQGMAVDKARKKVLKEEVIHDFKIEFQSLGFPRDQAQKQAERRLWLLENLEQQGMSAEEASRTVADLEEELKKSLGIMPEKESTSLVSSSRYDSVVAKHSTEEARWQQAEEAVKQHVRIGCDQLNLSPNQRGEQLMEALQCLGRYRKERVSPEEAKRRVFFEDLPFTVDLDVGILTGEGSMSLRSSSKEVVTESKTAKPVTSHGEASSAKPESESVITDRIMHFLGKLNAQLTPITDILGDQSGSTGEVNDVDMPLEPEHIDRNKEILTDEDRLRLLEEYDRKSRLEIQSLLTEMLRQQVPPDHAKQKLEALYALHAKMHEKLFPSKSKQAKYASPITNKLKSALRLGKDTVLSPLGEEDARHNKSLPSPKEKSCSISTRKLTKNSDRFSSRELYKDISHNPSPHKRKVDKFAKDSDRFSPHEMYSDLSRSPSPDDGKGKSYSPSNKRRGKSHSPSLHKRKRSRSSSLRKIRKRSHSPFPNKSRSRSLSPAKRKGRSRSPRTLSSSPSPRRPRKRSGSTSPCVSRKKTSASPVAFSAKVKDSSTMPQAPGTASSTHNPEDAWKSSVDMFLKETGKKNAKRSPSRHSSSSGSDRTQHRRRGGRYNSFSRSRSRSMNKSIGSHSPVRRVRRRSRSLSCISSASDTGSRRGRTRRLASRRRSSRGRVSDRRNSSLRSRDRSRSRSSFRSRNSGRRTRSRSRSHSRGNRSGLSSGSRERRGSERWGSDRRRSNPHLSPMSRSPVSRRSRDGSRSSYSRPRFDGAGPGWSNRRRDAFSLDRGEWQPDDEFIVRAPLHWGGKHARMPARRTPGSLDRVSSPSLSSSSSCFSPDDERITYPLGYNPPGIRGPLNQAPW